MLSLTRWFGLVKKQASSVLSTPPRTPPSWCEQSTRTTPAAQAVLTTSSSSPVAATTTTATKTRPWRRKDDNERLCRLQYAILVDAENIPPNSVEFVMHDIVVTLDADAPVRRVYGDFNKPSLMPWKQASLKLSFLPVHAFSYISGKGTSDSAMIIDTMELLYTNPMIDGFALVSSDSDFTRLAQRLREAGKHVIGFGSEHTPSPFCTACERFVYFKDLMILSVASKTENQQQTLNGSTEECEDEKLLNNKTNNNKTNNKKTTNNITTSNNKHHQPLYSSAVEYLHQIMEAIDDWVIRTSSMVGRATTKQAATSQGAAALPPSLIETINKRITEISSDTSSNGWVECGLIGQVVPAKEHGYKNLLALLRDYPQHFELQRVERETGGSPFFVRRRASSTADTTNTTTTTTSTIPSSSSTDTTNNNNSTSNTVVPYVTIEMLIKQVKENGDKNDGGWVQCGVLGRIVKAKEAREFGYKNLPSLLRDHPQHFEVREDKSSHYVRCCAAPGGGFIRPVNGNNNSTTTANAK